MKRTKKENDFMGTMCYTNTHRHGIREEKRLVSYFCVTVSIDEFLDDKNSVCVQTLALHEENKWNSAMIIEK